MIFIQISDIHFQYNNFQSDRLRRKFIDEIIKINNENSIDAILITGDIAHQGNKNSSESLKFIKNILKAINLDTSNVYITPGNHDLKRSQLSNLMLAGIFAENNPSEYLDELEQNSYTMLLKTHTIFFNNFKKIKGEDYSKDNLHCVHISEKYNIINLNTTLTCYKDGQEGSLLVSKKKFSDLLAKFKEELLDTDKINIAIGHHTLECLNPDEKQYVINLFDDYNIDIYLAGHVHQPNYYFTNNSNDFSLIELTSGSLFSDGYANPGFMCLKIDPITYQCKSEFYIWNERFDYWALNNNLGRRNTNGYLDFELSRLKKKELTLDEHTLLTDDLIHIDEDEFKEFIIDFHNSVEKRSTFIIDTDKRIELEEKFSKMKCSPTFIKDFDKHSRYFGNIDEIMNSTSYVSTEKKDLVADVIIEHYLDLHSESENGDKIFINVMRSINQFYNGKFCDYTELTIKRYIKILICWSIYECNIFNDEKVGLMN